MIEETYFKVIHWSVEPPKGNATHALPIRDRGIFALRDHDTKEIVGVRFRWKFTLESTTKQVLVSCIIENDYKMQKDISDSDAEAIIRKSYEKFQDAFRRRAISANLNTRISDLKDVDINLQQLWDILRSE